MRLTRLATAALLTAGLVVAATAAGVAAPPGAQPAARSASFVAAGPMSLRPGYDDGIGALLAQYGPCSDEGQEICFNGWVEVCQCYSYGCQFMATAQRC